MSIERETLRWNGWGLAASGFDLGGHEDDVWRWLQAELALPAITPRHAARLDEIELPKIRLADSALAELRSALGAEHVKTDAYERAFHARGKSYHDLLHLRAGDLSVAPDAVAYPGSADDVLAVLRWAAAHEVSVVPYGGGSSVVGGVNAEVGQGHAAVITLDTTRLRRVLEVDTLSHTATIEAGIYGPELERQLGMRGYTLGHFPQSFQFSTLGGWIAARGAGQQSQRYGRAEDWLVSARVATPAGIWSTESFPASAAGPDLNDVVAGGEGCFGVITEATVQVHPVPQDSDYRGYLFKDFGRGADAVRQIVQEGLPIAMVRLSDAEETRFFSAFSALRKPPGPVERAADRVLELGGWSEGRCLMLVGIEGEADNVKASLARSSSIVRGCGGFPLGRGAGKSWHKSRFAMPYLRDPLLDRGIGVDTLETSTTWANVLPMHRIVCTTIRNALKEHAAFEGARGMVMCHISHCYEDGASLYFTFVFPQAASGGEIAQWQAVKHAASEAIAAHGGTISHHHGVGTDHAPWLPREKGEIGIRLLRALKRELDPDGILNPGKLLG
jgi:alkyldihydroxyacetonephosphate synthase